MMRSEEITVANFAGVEWDDNYFKFCTFRELDLEVTLISSDFMNCRFENVSWYWGLFTQCNFIRCSFINCTFAGSSFSDARFVDCKLAGCNFIQDNLDASCSFDNAVAYGCSVTGCTGFTLIG